MEGDLYVTPVWVYSALNDVETLRCPIDPAPVNAALNFLEASEWPTDVVTNPPFSLADEFIRHALRLTKQHGGKVAMLLPLAFDSAKGRRDLFERPPFKAKYTLTKRIRWENLEQKKNGPSQNHAWFVWDWQYQGKPFLGYLPKIESIDATTDKRVG
jgi:hypothetical protein